LIHKFLVHSHKLYKIKFLYMFRAQSAHHQEVNDANCTYATSGIVTLCKWPSCAIAKEGLPVRTRKCRLQQRHFRDVTLTPARITDITLSRMTLGKCRLLLRHFRDVTLTPARITNITLWRKCLAPAAMLWPGFCTRSLQRRSKR
jgi:uncharacterized protein YjbI with pentapeptide repeats